VSEAVKPKHTPGPWSAKPDCVLKGCWVVKSETGWSVGELVIHLFPIKGLVTGDRTEADARVVAAAPDLLAACEGILPLLCQRNPSDEQFGEQNRRWNAALAALRAAVEAAH
jgi:hypothetical protein